MLQYNKAKENTFLSTLATASYFLRFAQNGTKTFHSTTKTLIFMIMRTLHPVCSDTRKNPSTNE